MNTNTFFKDKSKEKQTRKVQAHKQTFIQVKRCRDTFLPQVLRLRNHANTGDFFLSHLSEPFLLWRGSSDLQLGSLVKQGEEISTLNFCVERGSSILTKQLIFRYTLHARRYCRMLISEQVKVNTTQSKYPEHWKVWKGLMKMPAEGPQPGGGFGMTTLCPKGGLKGRSAACAPICICCGPVWNKSSGI